MAVFELGEGVNVSQFWNRRVLAPTSNEPHTVRATFDKKFGHLPGRGLMESTENFEARIKHAMETGDPGTLIRAPRKPGGLLVD